MADAHAESCTAICMAKAIKWVNLFLAAYITVICIQSQMLARFADVVAVYVNIFDT